MDNLRKALRVGAILAMLTFVAAVPMNAQTNSTGMGAGTGAGTTTTRTADRDDSTNWGWIGLLGLLGLAGLIPRKTTNTHRDDHNKHAH